MHKLKAETMAVSADQTIQAEPTMDPEEKVIHDLAGSYMKKYGTPLNKALRRARRTIERKRRLRRELPDLSSKR